MNFVRKAVWWIFTGETISMTSGSRTGAPHRAFKCSAGGPLCCGLVTRCTDLKAPVECLCSRIVVPHVAERVLPESNELGANVFSFMCVYVCVCLDSCPVSSVGPSTPELRWEPVFYLRASKHLPPGALISACGVDPERPSS